ncbi:Polyadenylate-binding protein RBP45C [Hibiscus syriacus]|uniref:Polyadenylate-binding protein RBP45C n=1 Tax=Hibiscus syriacus TaxID=106335 RepID=A0A6A2YBL4_HIBSY|nr:Polyadenylate-binding protein RBP45C [Hibiscus syriacus]
MYLQFAAAYQNTQGNPGEVHVKIPANKHCGFVQYANRASAEQALSVLNGTVLGGRNVRLSWGRSPSSKQAQPDQSQWNSGYYGHPQGYEAYGYAPPPQDPNMYYGGYPGYDNYQKSGAYQQRPQLRLLHHSSKLVISDPGHFRYWLDA